MKIEQNVMARGEMLVEILTESGEVKSSTGWVGNLILRRGLEERVEFWIANANYFRTYEDATPNKVILDGSYSQTGKTVTRVSGTGDFTLHNINDTLKFGDGKRGLITAITSASECEVYEDQPITAQAVTVYRTSPSSVPSGYKQLGETATAMEVSYDNTAGIRINDYEVNFPASTSDYSLASVWVNSYARIVLPAAVAVKVGERPRIRYRYMRTLSNVAVVHFDDIGIDGWPHKTPGTSIIGTATEITITTSEEHYFEAGDEVRIHDAKPNGFGVSAIVGNGSTWTVTTTAPHGFAVSDAVTIEGANPTGYNGTFVVATVVSPTVYTVAQVAILANSSQGITRPATPTPYFNGVHTVGSTPNLNTIIINTGLEVLPADTGSVSSKDASVDVSSYGANWGERIPRYAVNYEAPTKYVSLDDTHITAPQPTLGQSHPDAGAAYGRRSTSTHAEGTPTPGNNYTYKYVSEVSTSAVKRRIKQANFVSTNHSASKGFVVNFAHVQTKADGYTLRFEFNIRFIQELN